MKNILFCPAPSMENDLEERKIESAIGEAFNGKVNSLIYHQNDNDEELFDLVCEADLVVIMCDNEWTTTEKGFKAVHIAHQINKPIYKLRKK